jgi:glycolate oxidase FAD binding subunit
VGVTASLQLAPAHPAVEAFAAEVGPSDPVTCMGAGTQPGIGGEPVDGARPVRAPAGIVRHDRDEMIVRVLAGTSAEELDRALAERGQHCPLDPADGAATVGGVLAVGRSGIRRLRHGQVRDLLLEARLVASDGCVVKTGAPVVKNVTGYDLCRLHVGALGTLGFLGEVVLRCLPRPAGAAWFRTEADAWEIRKCAYRPSAVVTDGSLTWVLFEGRAAEIAAERSRLATVTRLEPSEAPLLPTVGRVGVAPSSMRAALRGLAPGSYLAEVGTGVVHLHGPVPGEGPLAVPALSPRVRRLNEDLKRAYDPTGRLNPGVLPW